MKVLFLTIVEINSLSERGIYTDLLNEFAGNGHEIYIICPTERRTGKKTTIFRDKNAVILNIRTLNLQKTNLIEKGIGTLLMEYQFLSAVKKYFSEIKFDLVIYSTPPITFSKVISFVKKRDNAYAYLLLKDIFPQNAVDMNMIKKGGLFHNFFLKKERELYEVSDSIGCMSEANRKYIISRNKWLNSSKVEVNPNSIIPNKLQPNQSNRSSIRDKYKIPLDSTVFIYGGNLGLPQGIDFLLETLTENRKQENIFFLIVGSGTQFNKIEKWFDEKIPNNALLIESLPKQEYDILLAACDVGMIFLNKKFTIPNFPSRLLSYLECRMPVIAATDLNTDIGKVIENANCGYWVESGDTKGMSNSIQKLISNPEAFNKMRENAYNLLISKFTAAHSYDLIVNKCISDTLKEF